MELALNNMVKSTLNNIEEYFISQNIPYHKNKFKFIIKRDTGNNFIIPGYVIYVFSKNKLMNKTSMMVFERFLIMLKDKNIDIKFYIYVCNITDIELLEYTSEINTYGYVVKFINNIDKLIPDNYIYHINTAGPVYTLAVIEDVSKYVNYPIYILKSQLIYASMFMTDDETNNLNKINLVVVDKLPDCHYKVALTTSNAECKNLKNDIVISFTKKIKYLPLPGGNRKPNKYIKGLSEYCSKCKGLFKFKYIINNICFKCSKLE